MRRAFIAAFILFAAVAPARAQLAVTSRIQAEDTSSPKRTGNIIVADFFTRFVMQLQTRRTKEVFEVKTYVRDGVVRVEGLAPLMGFPDHLVLISRGDGKDTWLDPIAQTYFVDMSLATFSMDMMVMDKSPKIESKTDSSATLLGRTAGGNRTEISVKLAPADPNQELVFDEKLGKAVIAERPALSEGKPIAPETLAALENGRERIVVRDRRVVVRTWTTTEFGESGALAAKTGVMAALNRALNLPVAGLPLRQIVQASSSNGLGQRWETVVTSVSTHTLPATAFEVPSSYTKGRPLLAPFFAR